MTRSDILAPAATVVVVDTELVTLAEVEHSLLVLGQAVDLPADVTACTHEVRDGAAHYAISFAFAAAPDADLFDALEHHFETSAVVRAAEVSSSALTAGGALAARQAAARDGGRAVRFPGWQHLTGTVTVGDALTVTAIDRLHQLGGGTVEDSAELQTRDFVRPRWQHGELVLAVLPAAGGGVTPFEVPNPTPCCAAHR